jgi:hypothetical protein
MVKLHSNMFSESNLSARYGLLIEYANWFVENVELCFSQGSGKNLKLMMTPVY